MGNYGAGTIEIPLEEFWREVATYQDHERANTFYGVPRLNVDNHTLEIDYMFNTECVPEDEFDFKESRVFKQWEELRNKNKEK